jgi:hypothetical protein
MLTRLRQLGANTVSTYVPWCWHEPHPDALDLDGRTDPQRDLPGFVRLCGRLGLQVILKPGPFTDAELLGGGVPPWLLAALPEAHALRPDGQPWRHGDSGVPRASLMHPAYLAAARRWIAAFSAVAARLQHPAGPVIAVQVENEIPGDGMLPADIGLDPRLRLDYNPHVTDVLWPEWLVRRDEGSASPTSRIPHPAFRIPFTFTPPHTLDDLRRYALLDAFTDWYHCTAVETVAGWLREGGWRVPLFHDLLAAPWEAGGTIADAPGLAHAAGWLGQNVYAEDVRAPFVGGAGYTLSFEEYVHFAFWRTSLVKSLSPNHPAFVPEISAAQDFFFAAPLLGGAQAINVYVLHQSSPDEPAAAAYPRWAMEAPVRPDGSVRPRFWNALGLFTLLGAFGADFAEARSPAAIALGYSHVPERVGAWLYQPDYLRAGPGWLPANPMLRAAVDGGNHATCGQLLAQRLVRAGIAFAVVDLDATATEALGRFALLLVPACGVLARAAQEKLAACSNLAFVGEARAHLDELLQPHTRLEEAPEPARLPEDVDATWIEELAEARGGTARFAWADAAEVDVAVRYGAANTYLFIANRRPTPYTGTLTYRSATGEVLHLRISLGALRIGAVVMCADEVVGASFGGDASEGGWLARGMHSSIVFSAGSGVAAPCGSGFVLSAPQSGRFQLRRAEGWDGLVAYRLLFGGALLPTASQRESSHLSVPYVAEDERGQTCVYALVPPDAPVMGALRDLLRTLLLARSALLARVADEAEDEPSADSANNADWRETAGAVADERLTEVALSLAALAERSFTPEEYGAAWQEADGTCWAAAEPLARELTATRSAFAAGALDEPAYRERENALTRTLELLARATLAPDRE